jgi:type II secretory pathway component PulF
MPSYTYTAVNRAGERRSGSVSSPGRREAIARLLAGGWHVLDLRESGADDARKPAGRRWGRGSLRLAPLCRQLATLCASGVPLIRSMEVLIEQAEDARSRKVLASILEAVKAGRSLSDALADHPKLFPEVMVSMVRVGEAGGALDDVLERLAELFEKQDEIRGEVVAALAYPVLVLLLGLASAIVLVVFVVPRLEVMFEGIETRLPLPTRILCGLSHFTARFWGALAAGAVAGVFAVRTIGARPAVRRAWDGLKLRLPVIGRLARHVAMGRFARFLGVLVHADVPVVESLNVVRQATGNAVIAEAVGQMAQQVQEGSSLAALMKSAGVFPPLPIQMVAVGEETGRLDQMLMRVAEAHDREATTLTKVMTSMLAPALILFVAAIVAFIIVALVLPIFRMSAGLH